MNTMNTQDSVQELLNGKGYVFIRKAFSKQDVTRAREIIMRESSMEKSNTVTHFQGGNEDAIQLQRRVWNLLNKGDIFIEMVQHPEVVKIVSGFLGDEFCLGSIAANRLLPGGPGQEPHIDYPYWDMYKKSSFPVNMNASFPLNCQVTIMLDDFNIENGATAILPKTQNKAAYPSEKDEKHFFTHCQRTTGQAGDVVIFNGLCWHCAMPNTSTTENRTAVLIQYLPKFVKPMEDQKLGVQAEIQEKASPLLRQLLGYSYPYPQILEASQAVNTEGRK